MISLVNDSEKRTKNPLQVDVIDRNESVVWVVVFACSTEAQYDRTQILYGIMKAAMTFSLPPCNDSPSSREWFNSTMQRRAKRDGTTISLLPFANILRQWTTIFWNCKNSPHMAIDETLYSYHRRISLKHYSSDVCVIRWSNSPMYHFHMLGSQQVRTSTT